MAAFTNEYDFIQAKLNADKILAKKLQEEEREKFTIEKRAKFLHDTIAAQRRFLAQQRPEAIRNKLPKKSAEKPNDDILEACSMKQEAAGMDKGEVANDLKAKNQEEWKLQSWIFYENCGVHVLRLEDGTEINMLEERIYPLTKHTLERMMDLRLIAVSDDDTVFDLLRFIVQQIDEFGGQDGSEKDL
ncbi:hypothetical protein Tco_0019834 [Tanacetum coccineum]